MWLLWRKRGIQAVLQTVGDFADIKSYIIEGDMLNAKVERFRLEKWTNNRVVSRFGGKKFRTWGDILQRMREVDDGP